MSKCTQCGTNFVGTPENPPVAGLCKYCENQKLKHDVALLWKALSELVGVSTKDELSAMELTLRSMPGIGQDKICAINAIHALQATTPT